MYHLTYKHLFFHHGLLSVQLLLVKPLQFVCVIPAGRTENVTIQGLAEHSRNVRDKTQYYLLLLFLSLSLRRALIVQIQLGLSVHLVLSKEEDVLRFVIHALHVRLNGLPLPPLEVRDRYITDRLLSGD